MILLLAVCGVAGLATGRAIGWMARRRYRAGVRRLKVAPPKVVQVLAGDEQAPRAPSARVSTMRSVPGERIPGFPCQLGDVVVLAHGEEAWLAGALTFTEQASSADDTGRFQRSVAALFVAPDAGVGRAIYARPEPEPSLDWMWPLAESDLALGREPPSAVEHDGVHFERVRRLPLLVVRAGEGAPDVGGQVVVGEYEGGAGARLLVVVAASGARAWRGRRLEPGMFDLLPAGST